MNKNIDYKLLFSVIALVVFWMIMISSVSVYSSFRVTSWQVNAWVIQEAYNWLYVSRNIIHVILWLIILWFTIKIKYSLFEKYSKILFWISIVWLFYVLITWLTFKWARWWISIPWIPFTIQPTEFLKISLILLLATLFKFYYHKLKDFKEWYLKFLWLLWGLVLLVWLQPDFWTIMVIVPVSVIMYFYSWMNIKHLLSTVILWFFLIFSVYSIWDYDKETLKNNNSFWYITQRIDNFLESNKEAIANKTINYQTEQALIAIWSWWFTWKWFWWSIQKFGYLPEVQWDFIFSVIIEELWFIWGSILLWLFFYIWYRWFMIAKLVKDKFAKLTAIWISSRILIQAFINIWVNLNIVPLTGITLPFVSYWWSSLLSLMFWLWILLSISREIENTWNFRRNRIIN